VIITIKMLKKIQ